LPGYYISIPVFKPWPMKMLSNPMGIMWEEDPNKSLWSLMAKAWSTIRDQVGKDNAPLHEFFAIICPYLGIPSQEIYLECHGWALTIDKDGAPSLSRDDTFQPISVGAGLAPLALSVEDIISYCQSLGYANSYVADPNATSPTFLGQSPAQNSGQTTQVKVVSQTATAIHDSRVLARNKRRNKRQTAKNIDVVRNLQAEITDAHIKVASYQGSDLQKMVDSEDAEFYDAAAAELAANNAGHANYSTNAPTLSGPVGLVPVNWNAFQVGADEDATLPLFQSSIL